MPVAGRELAAMASRMGADITVPTMNRAGRDAIDRAHWCGSGWVELRDQDVPNTR
jgi:hypothetical protein